MNETIRTLLERRSVRAYKNQPVSEEHLALILKAGTYAPTAMNRQSPIMVAVTDPAEVALLSRMNAAVMNAQNDPFYGAPAVIVVLADRSIPAGVYDGSLVMGNLMNAAHSLGVGSCWIHRAKEVFDSEEGKALLKKWGIEGDYVGVGNCILGYPEGDLPAAKPRKENYIYYVK